MFINVCNIKLSIVLKKSWIKTDTLYGNHNVRQIIQHPNPYFFLILLEWMWKLKLRQCNLNSYNILFINKRKIEVSGTISQHFHTDCCRLHGNQRTRSVAHHIIFLGNQNVKITGRSYTSIRVSMKLSPYNNQAYQFSVSYKVCPIHVVALKQVGYK